MKNHKSYYLKRILSLALASSMTISMLPVNVFANSVRAEVKQAATANASPALGTDRQASPDAVTSPTYYKKANWENKIKDKSRWKVEDSQRLVRVSGSDPVEMNDIDYDGMFIDANGRYVIRLVYKEKSQAASVVWYRALLNFGDLAKYIDYDRSYVLGKDGKTQFKFEDVNGVLGKGFDIGKAAGDRTTNRKNLPINIVLNEGVDLNTLGDKNYIVQMRLTDGNYKRVYAYAPKGTSMDYSTYTKTTSVDLVDKLGTLFIKGGKQSDHKNATNQEFFMSEFIANPDQYPDKLNLGIIRTQYMGQTNPIVRETVGDQPIAFTQVFDANLVKYLKVDDKGNVGYVNVMTNGRTLSPHTKNVGIPLEKINYTDDHKLAYIVIGKKDFTKDGVNVVNVDKLDQHVMLSGFYITAIDYVVDKSKFEDTFKSDKVRKLNYSMMSGWTNPNKEGWVVYEKDYDDDYVVPEGESYLIDTGDDPSGGQIMIQVGGDQAILRKPQGYYNGYVSGDGANDTIEKYANGVYKFTLREGATILKGKKLKVFMPYTSSHDKPVNFLEIHNGTKLNEGAATLTLQTDRNINMHLYTELPRGATFKLKYTLKGEKEQKELVFTKPKGIGTLWQYNDADKVLTGVSNRSILSSGGNFYINTTKLEPGADIYVEAYDENGKEIVERKSWFKYKPLDKSQKNVKELTWVDHSDKKSVLSVNKSLYTPYQLLFTNDYAEGTDDFYKEPRVLPAKNDDFKKDTKEFVGYTKYDGGKVRTLYAEGKTGKLFAKVQADENEYDDKGNLVGKDVSKKITIPKSNIFDAQFDGDNKEYTAYEYKVDLTKMLPYHSDDKKETPLTLLKDMKFVSNASDGSSLPSDLYETRVRARVLFDTTDGKFADNTKKAVKIVPDNIKFYGEEGYSANGFEGANVEANTGDKFPEAPTLTGKNFLGWVTEAGKKALGDKAVVTADAFGKLTKDQIFTNETPVTKHQVVYAIYSDETAVTFDANGGKFTDVDKDTTTVKVENEKVTKPADPTRDGYTFKGWAATKDAKEADANILNDVKAPKTVYAVWEKTEKTPLELKAPTPVEVKDTKSLTSDEIDKVKKAVAEANKDKGITEADITVAEDGTVTVTKDGKTGTLTPKQTVKQKEVQNNFNPPKEPVKVDKIGELKPDEIAAIKQAVKDANPDRNFKDEDITVEADGTVKINQGGKVGTISADKTVVQKDTILDLTPPEKTEVKDVTNLTQDERDKVAAAVKAKNNLADGDKVEVDSKGNVKVTTADGKKTGTLEGKDTVKPFTRDGKKLNPPEKKVKVGDTNKLTEAEKQAVKDAVKAANPDLGFTDDEIQVDDNGTVTVPITDSKNGTFEPEQTIEKAKETDKIIKLVAPEKTPVQNINELTQAEKEKVKEAVKKANPKLPDTAKIEVADDGSVVVTDGEKTGTLSQKDTVVDDATKLTLNKPRPVKVKDPQNVTTEEQAKIKEAVKDVNPTLTDDQIKVDDKGNVTVTVKEGETTKTAKLGPEDTIEKDEAPETDIKAPKTPVTVDNSKALTQEDKDKVKKAVEDANKDGEGKSTLPEGATIDVADDGTVTVKDKTGKEIAKIEPAKTVKQDESKLGVKAPTPVEVADPNNVTPAEQEKIKEAVKAANPDLADATIEVDNKGNVTVKKDGKEGKLTPAQTVKKAEETGIKAPETPITVDNAKALTPENKKAVEDAVKKANKDLPEGAKVEVADDGTVTVKDKDDKVLGTIPAEKTVKQDESKLGVKAPTPVEVADPNNVTPAEQEKIKEAVKAANPDLADATIEVDNKGNVTVKKDGKEGKLTPAQTVKKAEDTQAPGAPTVKANNDGTVTVTPPTDADTKEVSVTYIPEGKTDPVTVTATKDPKTGKWSVPEGSDVTVDPNTGVITVPADKVKDGTEVSAVAKDEAGNASTPTETSKAKAKTPVDKTELKAEVAKEDATKKDVKYKNATKEKQEDYDAALAKAKKVLEDPNALQKDIDDALKALKEAEAALDGTAKPADELVAPANPVEVKDPSKLTDDEKKAVEKAVRDANPTLPKDAKVTVGDDGSVTVTDKDGNEIGKLKPEQTVKGVLNAPTEPVEVKDPSNLTDEEKAEVEEAVKKANPYLPADATIEVGNDGTVTVTDKDGNEIGAIPADKTVKGVLNAPTEPVEVKDPENLTDEEKDAVEKAVKDANPNLPEGAKVTVGDDGKVTVTDKDGNEIGTIPAKQAVKKAVDKTGLEAEVAKKDATKASDKYKYADAAKKKAYDDALAKAKEVLNNPEASQAEVDAAKEALEKAADELNGKATDKSKLEAEVAKKDATKASDKYKYADATKKKAYDDALANAMKVLNNPKASQADVDAAKKALEDAKSALNGTKPSDGGTTPSYPSYPSYPSNPQTPGTTTENRVSGNDRIQTAIEISKKYFGHADTVIVVDSNNYADAITASVLSKLMNAPILLTDTHKLDPRVGAEIERLGAKDVIIVGGHNSVADSVKGELKAYDEDSVERIWGNDRYETSAQVARRIVGITGKKGHAVIASGEVFADALAVGPYAAQQGYPILLVQAKNIPTSINKALKDLGIKNVTIAGGINTVSKSLENPLPNVVERLQGKSRYETAIAIAQSKFPQAKEAFLVNGEQWMDALVIAPVGGIMSKPILLTPSNNAPQSLKDYLIKSEIERLTAVGGNRMVSEQVLKELTKK